MISSVLAGEVDLTVIVTRGAGMEALPCRAWALLHWKIVVEKVGGPT